MEYRNSFACLLWLAKQMSYNCCCFCCFFPLASHQKCPLLLAKTSHHFHLWATSVITIINKKIELAIFAHKCVMRQCQYKIAITIITMIIDCYICDDMRIPRNVNICMQAGMAEANFAHKPTRWASQYFLWQINIFPCGERQQRN